MNPTGPYKDAKTKNPPASDRYFCRYVEYIGKGRYRHGYDVIHFEVGHGWFTGMSKTVAVVQWAEINKPKA